MKRIFVDNTRELWAWETADGMRVVAEDRCETDATPLDWASVMVDGDPVGICLSENAPREEARRIGLRALFDLLSPEEYAVAAEAIPIVEWRRTSRYCGVCAETMQRDMGERCMVCPACKNRIYPRLNPAVITCITRDNGEEVLLARKKQSFPAFYSVIAGFVEAGESLEHAIAREVREEVGIEVGNLRYFGSQGWPFPNSLMVGFLSEWVSGDIHVDGVEIEDAGWFRRDSLPPLPGRISIARRMIDAWQTLR